MSYEVTTPVYEGPFDMLLHLILREQVDLYEVSLSAIVDAFVAELARLETLDLEIATEFLLIASTLVELKEEALARLEAGAYGICESCDEPISEKRLLARPVTTLCIDCKAEAEQLEKQHVEGEE